MIDYVSGSEESITKLIKGKTVEKVIDDYDHGDSYLIFKFTDGTELKIRYDYIYEWEVR